MKKLSLLFLTTICVLFSALAQNGTLSLCEDYDKSTGKPSGAAENWDINSKTGSYVYMIYQQSKNIKENIKIYVDKKNESGTYKPFETIEITEEDYKNKNWFMYDFLFRESGDYKISVMGKSDYPLATKYTKIYYMKEETSSTDNSDNDENSDASDTYYYEDSKIVFGKEVVDGEIKNPQEVFNLQNGKAEFFCVLSQDNALLSKSITVGVYHGDDYKDLLSEEVYTLGGLDWNWVKIPISITKRGKYLVDIYNDLGTYINSEYFEVK